MPLTFTPEQEELRAVVRKFLATLLRRGAGPRPDGQRPGLRHGRLEADGRPARHPVDRHPGGVRRRRLRLRRALRRARGGRTGAALLTAVLHGGAGRHDAPRVRRRRSRSGAPARHRRGPHGRHPRAHRGGRPLVRGRDPGPRRGRRRPVPDHRHQALRARRRQRRPGHRRRADRSGDVPVRRGCQGQRRRGEALCPRWTRPGVRPRSSSPTLRRGWSARRGRGGAC